MSHLPEQHKSQALFEVALRREEDPYEKEELGLSQDAASQVPSICGLPLKYVSCVSLPSPPSCCDRAAASHTTYSPRAVHLAW